MVNGETMLKLLATWAKEQTNRQTKQTKKPIVTKVRKVVILVKRDGGYLPEKA